MINIKNKILIFLILVFLSTGFLIAQKGRADSSDNIYGYAWSENIGWISFNCYNDYGSGMESHCKTDNPAYNSDYGVSVDLNTGKLSGYAWAGGGIDTYYGTDAYTIGWIRMDPPSSDGYPAIGPAYSACLNFPGPGQVCEGQGNNAVSGWARACAVFESGCEGDLKSNAERGGWDGWIKLKGQAQDSGDYGIQLNVLESEFKDWAWAGDSEDREAIVGWISFNAENCDLDSNNFVDVICGGDNATIPVPIYRVRSNINFPGYISGVPSLEYKEYCLQSPIGQVGLKWTYDDKEGDWQERYALQVATDPGFAGIVVDYFVGQSVAPGGEGTSLLAVKHNPSGHLDIAYGDNYWWRVRVKAESGNTDWSDWVEGPNFSIQSRACQNPSFTWDPESPSAGMEVIFTDTSTCYNVSGDPYSCSSSGATSYLWDFGDGDTDPAKGDVSHIYSEAGNFTVRLEITDTIDGLPKTCYEEEVLEPKMPLPQWREVAPF